MSDIDLDATERGHAPEWSCGNSSHTNPSVGCPDCCEVCGLCGQDWPCETHSLVAEVRRLQARVAELETGIERLSSYYDTHVPGPFVKDGNWHTGPCVEGGPNMEDIHPDGLQVCADEDCGMYWPCPIEELRSLLSVNERYDNEL